MDEVNPPGPGRASHIHDYKGDTTKLAQTKTFQLSIWQSCHGQLSFTAPPLVGTKPSCSWTAFSWSSPGVPGTETGTHFSPTPTNAGTVFLSPAWWITTYAPSPGRAGTWLRSQLCSSGAGRCLVRAIGPPAHANPHRPAGAAATPRERAGCSCPAAPRGCVLAGVGDPSRRQQGPSSDVHRPCEAQAPGCHGWGVWEAPSDRTQSLWEGLMTKKPTNQKTSGVFGVWWQMGRCLKFQAEAVKAKVQKAGGGLGS